VIDQDFDLVEVVATSDCGTVSNPLEAIETPGEYETTVRCESVGRCSIYLTVSDDGFTDCDGTTVLSGRARVYVDCVP
jgi:hypothetical protein